MLYGNVTPEECPYAHKVWGTYGHRNTIEMNKYTVRQIYTIVTFMHKKVYFDACTKTHRFANILKGKKRQKKKILYLVTNCFISDQVWEERIQKEMETKGHLAGEISQTGGIRSASLRSSLRQHVLEDALCKSATSPPAQSCGQDESMLFGCLGALWAETQPH